MECDNPIGIFDSGIGGLTVFEEVHKLLPSEDLIYLGDTARVPYGTKSPETVIRYTLRNILFLLEHRVKAVVVACNTASAYGLEALKGHFRVPVIGVIEPGAKRALEVSRSKVVGVIGTEGTISCGAYQKSLQSLDSRAQVLTQACPLLVELAEEGRCEGEIVDLVLREYLAPFLSGPMVRQAPATLPAGGHHVQLDTLILGCTHYPLFKKAIGKMLGDRMVLVDSGPATASALSKLLVEKGLSCTKNRAGKETCFTTDAPERMKRLAPLFLGREIPEVTQVEIKGF